MTDNTNWQEEIRYVTTATVNGVPIEITVTPGQARLVWTSDEEGKQRDITLPADIVTSLNDKLTEIGGAA